MRAPAFWTKRTALARVLQPLGLVYGAITAWRMGRPGVRAQTPNGRPVPVLCIGNPIAGGAGKTPTVEALARRLSARGERPFILSRGYGGRTRGPLRVDPGQHDAALVGDEPLLLAATAPVIVAADRAAGAQLAVAQGASILLMDDGLQNSGLYKDLALAVLDAGAGVGNGFCIPAGPLRAPLRLQEPYVDATLVVSVGDLADGPAARLQPDPVWRFRAMVEPDLSALAGLRDRPFAAFAGIGRPAKFFDSLTAAGLFAKTSLAFPDHHPYTAADLAALTALAASGLTLVTTAKDAVKLAGRLPDLHVIPVRLSLAEADLDRLIDRAMANARARL